MKSGRHIMSLIKRMNDFAVSFIKNKGFFRLLQNYYYRSNVQKIFLRRFYENRN